MAGSSLWLVPPPCHPLHAILTKLITASLPSHFPSSSLPPFSPHMTLTSNIDPSQTYDLSPSPQAWLDSIPFPSGAEVGVRFERVKTEDVFFRRCYVKVGFEGVRGVAGIARARGVNGEEGVGEVTERWLGEWRASFGPHVSLVYGDMTIDDDKLKEIEKAVTDAGISLGEAEVKGSEGIGAWEGGTVWLVPTDKSIDEWKPIATRTL